MILPAQILHEASRDYLAFWCPACEHAHTFHIGAGGWTFNGNYEAPTFSPSMALRGGHYAKQFKAGDNCWCKWNKEHPEDGNRFVCGICHFIVTVGQIHYQADCTHAMKSQIVPMVPYRSQRAA